MLVGPAFYTLLLLGMSSAQTRFNCCKCSLLPPAGIRVNCSSRSLTEMPHLPLETTELHLQDNHLSTIPKGFFDRLQNLKFVNLSGNAFYCGCEVRYLRLWLKRIGDVAASPVCAGPAALAGKAVADLSDADVSSCSPGPCSGGLYKVALALALCVLVAMLLWCLWLAKNSTYTLGIDVRHTGFRPELLHSLKPKHRTRLQDGLLDEEASPSQWTDEIDQPLLNMEILPQILDVLHNKHNIKIKET